MAQNRVRNVPTFRAPSAYEEEMLRAQRQQQLAEMLRQQAFEPEAEPYTFQGFRATPSPANAIARVLSAYTAKKVGEKAEASERAAREADIAGAEEVLRGLGPQTRSVTGGALPETDVTGIASAYQPEMAQQPMMETVMPTAQERRDLLMQTMVRGTPMARQLAQFLAAQEPKTTTTEFGGQLLNVTGDTATPVTMGGKPVTAAPKPAELPSDVQSYQYYVQQESAAGRPTKTFEQWKAGQKSPPVSISLGDKGSVLGQELYLKKLDAQETAARGANRMLGKIGRLDAATQKGTFTGAMAPNAKGAAEWLASFGVQVKPEVLANTAEFEAAVAGLAFDFISANGGARGFTEKETEMVMKMFPQILNSPQARQQIGAILRDKAMQDIADYNTSLQNYKTTYKDSVIPYQPIEDEDAKYRRWVERFGKPNLGKPR